MIDLQEFEVEVKEYTTVWIGDPAVDVVATDIRSWIEKGDGWAIKSEKEPSYIRYKTLCPREKLEATRKSGMVKFQKYDDLSSREQLLLTDIYFWECARFGLVGISGIQTETESYDGVPGMAYQLMRKLDRIKIPKDAKSPLDVVAGHKLLNWIGRLIAEASFREQQ